MTPEKVIELARKAGIEFAKHTGITGKETTSTLGSQRIEVMQRFAQLVRNEVLEEAAIKSWSCGMDWHDVPFGTIDDCEKECAGYEGRAHPLYLSPPPPPAEVPMLSDEELLLVLNAAYESSSAQQIELFLHDARLVEAAVRRKAGL